MGVVFAAVVEAFTKIILDILGLIVRVEGLSGITLAGINVGNFLTALITFLLSALVLYFAVVVPYNKLSELRKQDEPEKAASSEDLLAEICDLLRERESWRASGSGAPAVPGRLSEQTRSSAASE